jgi:hypothetical protein
MIDTVLNLLFRCAHRHLTLPITPVNKAGVAHGETYVVCLDCTKQFAYDFKEMRMGKAIDHSHDACVLPPKTSMPGKTKLKYALGVGVPLAVLIGSALKARKVSAERKRKEGIKADSDRGHDA